MPRTFQLPRSTPEDQGISAKAIVDFMNAAEKTIQYLHSFMLLRHGQVVAEAWWFPWQAETPHELFSLSKSFTSTAVGLAVAEGRLSVDDRVISFFPGDTPRKVSPNLEAMKVRHLLCMSTGHDQDTTERTFRHPNPIRGFLTLPVEHEPGTHFVYNSAASFMLSAIVQKLTRQTLLDYLKPRLFDPLEIEGATWESHPNGTNFGGWGLKLKTEDIARFGQLYLQNGTWEGKRILPENWVKAATSKQVSNGDDPESDWTQGYGYQFWRCRHHIYRGDGAFGQFCIVMPQQQAVLAITAGVPDMQVVLNLVWDTLLPAMKEDQVQSIDANGKALLELHRRRLIPAPEGTKSSALAAGLTNKMYLFTPNYETLHSLSFSFEENECIMTYRLLGGGKRRGKHQLKIGYGEWIVGEAFFGGLMPKKVAASGVWIAEDKFVVTVCQVETPSILTIACRFEGEHIYYDCKANVAFGPLERPQLVGTLAPQAATR
jgi:CubicO group peptidase (beta-lactamase class C family)